MSRRQRSGAAAAAVASSLRPLSSSCCVRIARLAGLPRSAGSSRTAASAPPLSSLKQRDPGASYRGPRRRRHAPRLHPGRRPAPAGHGQRDPEGAQGGDGRDRGRALLQAQGRRLRGHRPRRGQERRPSTKTVQGGSTLTMQLVRNLYTQDDTRDGHRRLQAQDPRGEARRASSRTSTPRTGSSPSTSTRSRTARSAARPRSAPARPRALYFNKRVARADAARGRDARRHAAGAVGLLAGRSTQAAPRRAATRCWARWPSSG